MRYPIGHSDEIVVEAKTRRPREARAPGGVLRDWVRSGEDEVSRVLRLGCGVHEKFAIVAKFPEPSGKVRGLIGDHLIGDSGFGAKISRSHFRDQFFSGIDGGPERGGFGDAFADEPLPMSGAVGLMPISA